MTLGERDFFRTGTIWLQELEWHLIAPIALIGMSYTLLKGEQVRVDFLYDQMPQALRQVVQPDRATPIAVEARGR